jgi:EAL domain-containing protein (putative c-di-GMP-specific phosphodiesterase class I)
LHRLPVDTIKIDRSFVGNMNTGDGNYEIVRTIVALAHTLGKAVIAEGPETAEQVSQLRTLGCEYAQGYFFARPMDAESAEAMIRTYSFL